MAETLPRPPFDPELEAVLAVLAEALPPAITPEMIPVLRQGLPGAIPIDELLAEAGVERVDHVIPGYGAAISKSACCVGLAVPVSDPACSTLMVGE